MTHDLLRLIADAIGSRANATPAQKQAAMQGLIQAIVAYVPRDPVETMLAGMIAGHLQLSLDATRDLLGCEDIRLKIRIRAQILALDRQMLGFMRELRAAQKRQPAPEQSAPAPVEDRLAALEATDEDLTDAQREELLDVSRAVLRDAAAALTASAGAGRLHRTGAYAATAAAEGMVRGRQAATPSVATATPVSTWNSASNP